MKNATFFFKYFGFGFLFLVIRKIVIACMAMYVVWQNWEDVGFDRLVSEQQFLWKFWLFSLQSTNPSLKLAVSQMHPNRSGLILILNKHALNMTFNWLCNTQHLDGEHNLSIITSCMILRCARKLLHRNFGPRVFFCFEEVLAKCGTDQHRSTRVEGIVVFLCLFLNVIMFRIHSIMEMAITNFSTCSVPT